MPRKGKYPPKGGKPGAKPGNKNALRHGFYAKKFTSEENKDLDSQNAIDIKAEIALIRTCLRRLQEELSFDEVTRTDDKGNETRDDHYLKQLNTLSIMTSSISTLVRTHYLVTGKGGDVTDSILKALEELRLELGI